MIILKLKMRILAKVTKKTVLSVNLCKIIKNNNMKKSHLIAILIVAVAIGLLITASKDVTTYANFTQAAKNNAPVKLVGQLVKDRPVEYNPEKNANLLAFYLKDDAGEVRQVVLKAAKPQDFERSEQIVLTGQMEGDVFQASDMLLKCPSKYKDQEVYVREKKS
jgi:cytochrome c-type biogenesis protein CcmE